ncbi:hypothetical protein F5Y04DRAFT_79347 [Hypomontagnella monticulosa]|nr:hypothetical protein F5Y04DRAFT_79347 [Hypomontagnella monticulosa]
MHFLVQSLIAFACFSSLAVSDTPPEGDSIILEPALDLLGAFANAPPPEIIWTPKPSAECATINQGELQCCLGTVAGDLPLIVFLAGLYGYKLNPNDVNGISCNENLAACPGVKMCCQVTALNPILSLYCQDYK